MNRNLKLFFIVVFAGVFFTGCLENYEYFVYYTDFATVENPQQSSEFFLRLDDSTLLWTAASALSNYKPEDGKRLFIKYSILSDKSETGMYDYDIQLHNVYEILTKSIFEVTPETQDSIGNDPINVSYMRIGSKYLNIEYAYLGFVQTHYINLVSDTAKTYNDDKIHLEFRHNANNDEPFEWKAGLVSFDLSSLQDTAKDSVQLVIHLKEYNQLEKEYPLTYYYRNIPASGIMKKDRSQQIERYVREDCVQ